MAFDGQTVTCQNCGFVWTTPGNWCERCGAQYGVTGKRRMRVDGDDRWSGWNVRAGRSEAERLEDGFRLLRMNEEEA